MGTLAKAAFEAKYTNAGGAGIFRDSKPIVAANLRTLGDDISDSVLFSLNDQGSNYTNSTPFIIADATFPDSRRIEFGNLGTGNFETTGDSTSDNTIFDTLSLPNNTIISMDLELVFIKSDGSSGGAITLKTVWRKDNSGTLTNITNTPAVFEDAAGTWALTTVNSGEFIQSRTTRSGSTSGTYRQCVHIKTKIIHSY